MSNRGITPAELLEPHFLFHPEGSFWIKGAECDGLIQIFQTDHSANLFAFAQVANPKTLKASVIIRNYPQPKSVHDCMLQARADLFTEFVRIQELLREPAHEVYQVEMDMEVEIHVLQTIQEADALMRKGQMRRTDGD